MTIGERIRYLGSDSFTWWDLKVLVSETDRSSPLMRAMDPDTHTWGLDQQLMASLVDIAAWLRWSKTKDAQSNNPTGMPKPIPRPGVESEDTTYKYDTLPADEMMEFLGWE